MTEDEPESRLWQGLFETAFRVHPYRFPIIGRRAAFAATQPETVRAYHRRHYTTGATVAILVGDVEPASAWALLERWLGGLPAAPAPAIVLPEEPMPLAPRESRLHGEVELTRAVAAWPIPGLGHPDQAALDVLAAILGAGQDSVLWRELRERRRLVHAVEASTWNPGRGGLFTVALMADPVRAEEARQVAEDLAQAAAVRRWTQPEIDKAVRQAIVAELNGRKTVGGQAARLGVGEVVLHDLDPFGPYLRELTAVTPARLREVAARHLVASRRCAAVLEPRRRAAAASVTVADRRPGPWVEEALAGGLHLLTQEDRRLPLVHLRVVLRGGPLEDPRGQEGVSALLATLLTRDTARRTAAEVDAAIERVGGLFASFAGNNSLGLTAEVLPGDLDLALELIEDGLFRPAFDPARVAVEREAQLADLQDERDDAIADGRRRLRERFFGSHPLASSSLGRPETVARLDAGALRDHLGRLLVPGNLVVALAGAWPDERWRRRVAGWSRRLGRLGPAWTPGSGAGPWRPPAQEVQERVPREQALVLDAYPGPGLRAEDNAAAEVAHELLSGLSSELFDRVREKRALAYFVRAARVIGFDLGMFFLEAGTQPGGVAAVQAEFEAEVARLAAAAVRPDEIARARAHLVAQRRMHEQTASARCLTAALNHLAALPVDEGAAREAALAAVDAGVLAAFARRWLDPAHRVRLVLQPERTARDEAPPAAGGR